MAKIYHQNQDFISEIEYLGVAIKLCSSDEKSIELTTRLAQAYKKINFAEKAITTGLEAIELCQKIGETGPLTSLYHLVAMNQIQIK